MAGPHLHINRHFSIINIPERTPVQIMQAGKCAMCVGSLGTKTESSGDHKWKNPGTRQVQTQPEASVVENPIDYLVSSDDDDQSSVKTVRVQDTGSKVMYANVDLHGVPVKGVIDSGADITILGGDLFKCLYTYIQQKCHSAWCTMITTLLFELVIYPIIGHKLPKRIGIVSFLVTVISVLLLLLELVHHYVEDENVVEWTKTILFNVSIGVLIFLCGAVI